MFIKPALGLAGLAATQAPASKDIWSNTTNV
jgi:hypothetical protein